MAKKSRTPNREVNRRKFISIFAAVGALPGCGGGGDDDGVHAVDSKAGTREDTETVNLRNQAGSAPVATGAIDLSKWQLELPVNSEGRLNGDAQTLDHPFEKKGPSNLSTYFRAFDGQFEFVAPAFGAQTSANAGGARCELKQSAKLPKLRWNAKKAIRSMALSQRLQTTQSGSKPRVVIGQIHDGRHNLVMVKYYGPPNATGNKGEKGVVKAVFNFDEAARDGQPAKEAWEEILDDSYKLGDKMTVTLSCVKGVGTVSYATSAKPSAVIRTRQLDTPNEAGASYFKFGAYAQRDGADVKSVNMAWVTVESARFSV